ncbi:MAG: MCE family protein [Alistipes sp.]|nr:MCE family protein [Alistipes sp.]
MKIKRELKVGVFAVLVIAVAWWGIKWLGGQNVLLTNNIYYVYYDDVSGLQESSLVKLRGVKIGNVTDIVLERDRVLVELAVETKYEDMIPSNSIAEIGAAGLMGGVEIVIKQGDSAEPIANDGFLEGSVKPDMIGMLADGGSALIEELNATVESLHTMLDGNSETITSLVANLESVTATIDKVLASGQIQGALNNLSSFTDTLAENEARIDSMLANLDNFTGELAEADVVSKLTTTVESLNGVLAEINNQEGTVGKLLNDSELYDSLSTAGDNLGLLLEDLKANPMRYVHFSLFGTSEEKIAEKEAKREARRAKREAKKGTTTESAE